MPELGLRAHRARERRRHLGIAAPAKLAGVLSLRVRHRHHHSVGRDDRRASAGPPGSPHVAEFWEDHRVPPLTIRSWEVVFDRETVGAPARATGDGRWCVTIHGGAIDNGDNDGTTWIGTYLPPKRS